MRRFFYRWKGKTDNGMLKNGKPLSWLPALVLSMDYSLFLMASVSFSKPGFPKRANMFFL